MSNNKLVDIDRLAYYTARQDAKNDAKYVPIGNGATFSSNDYTDAEKEKLAGIEAGAQVNTITGVKGDSEESYRTGNVNITKANIGLGDVDNTADSDKSVAYAVNAGTVNNLTVETAVPANAKFTDTTYSKMSASEATTGTATTARTITAQVLANYVASKLAELVNSAPETLDTLKELADALGNDASFANTVTTELGKKLDKTGGTVTGTLTLTRTTDASATKDNKPALIVGGASTAAHLELDGNEIMAKADGTNAATLYINNDGGQVQIGSGGLTVSGAITGNVTGDCSGSSGSCTGNAATATKLATARTINIQDSSATNTGTGASFNGNANATIKLPATIKAEITGNCSGTSSNVTGTVALANGGTGATTRLAAAKVLTNENVGTGAQYFVTLTSNWGKFGYSSTANAKSVLGIDNVDNTADSAKVVASAAACTGNAATATTLKTARAIDGVNFDGSAAITHYGSCATEADVAAKEVACTGFKLATGSRIIVKFTATNTAASPTLSVNSTTAKAIYYRGAAITAGYLVAKHMYEFVYDGSHYELVGDIDTDTHWTSHLYVGGSKATANAATENGGTYLSLCDNSTNRANIKITGSGGTTVTSNASGVITINSTDTNTDTLMTQNVSTTNSTYPLLMCPTANATANQGAKTGIFSSKAKVNASTGAMSLNGKAVPVVSSFNSTTGVLALVSSGS